MKIVSDSIAMRHLISLGYDVPAQMLLRSIGEYSELYVAILDDPNLANEFVLSDTPPSAKKFWNTYIARGALQKRVEKAWHDWFSAKEPAAASWFANWRRTSNIRLSAFIHPSFAGGMFSAIPFKTKHTNDNWLGIWGDKSEGSVDTIYMYASYMFPIFLLHHGFPFEGLNAFLHAQLKYNEKSELHKHVQDGRYVLASLILSLGKHSNRKYIFPKYDLSIFKKRSKRKRE